MQTPEWQRDLERNFWTANFMTGTAAYKFMETSSREFKALWTQIGTSNP
jgi:tripartite-type tricarboxylate transporter receptor subunit TctC